ncbi:MAG: LacI family DNA-binding transcriptional regulator [Anaerolineales bacterium]|nr:LacI family DNA-binding transcriptional regulator [Anaerolineales bacterium]
MATISDVANLARVSTATVSHVINKTRKVNPETIERVEAAILVLGYRPNPQARSLKTGLSRQIGVLNLSDFDPYFSEVLMGIEGAAREAGYGMLISHSEFHLERQMADMNLLLGNGVDGLIINSLIEDEEIFERLRCLRIPYLLLQFYSPDLPADCIHNDDEQAGYNATVYLLGLGHTRIGCISGYASPTQSAYNRLSGYRRALEENNIPFKMDYFCMTCYTLKEGYDSFINLQNLPEKPTAVITYSDPLAIAAIRAAVDLGLSVPGDISVIGFDDIEFANYSIPRLTTIYQEKALLGRLAFEMLIKRIHQPDLPFERKILPSHLVIRESCSPLMEE